jgi:hypothetical protein
MVSMLPNVSPEVNGRAGNPRIGRISVAGFYQRAIQRAILGGCTDGGFPFAEAGFSREDRDNRDFGNDSR